MHVANTHTESCHVRGKMKGEIDKGMECEREKMRKAERDGGRERQREREMGKEGGRVAE